VKWRNGVAQYVCINNGMAVSAINDQTTVILIIMISAMTMTVAKRNHVASSSSGWQLLINGQLSKWPANGNGVASI